jgi:hypothetical protein
MKLGNILAVIAMIGLVACGNNPAAKLSPEGKAAYYGEKFMSVVEQAQKQTIALVGTGSITRESITPVVEVYGQIGKAGQELANALDIVDKSNVTADKQAAAVRVRTIMLTAQDLLNNLVLKAGNDETRESVIRILNGLKMAASVFDVIQSISPFLPEQTKSGALLTLNPALQGGM